MIAISLRQVIVDFVAEYNSRDDDCPFTDESIAKGLRAGFTASDIPFIDDVVFLDGDLSTPEDIERATTQRAESAARQAERVAKWRAENPELAAREDLLGQKLAESFDSSRDLLAKDFESIFRSNHIFDSLRKPGP